MNFRGDIAHGAVGGGPRLRSDIQSSSGSSPTQDVDVSYRRKLVRPSKSWAWLGCNRVSSKLGPVQLGAKVIYCPPPAEQPFTVLRCQASYSSVLDRLSHVFLVQSCQGLDAWEPMSGERRAAASKSTTRALACSSFGSLIRSKFVPLIYPVFRFEQPRTGHGDHNE